MSARHSLGLVVALVLASAVAGCDDRAAHKQPIVQFVGSTPVAIQAGDDHALGLEFAIAEDHHIQANPAAQESLVPARLELLGPPMIDLGEPRYPPGHTFVLEGSDWNLSTYDGRITIELPIRTRPGIESGWYTLEGAFSYQACNRRSCLRPTSIPITVALEVSSHEP